MPRFFVIPSKATGSGAVLLALTLVALAWTVSCQQVTRSSASDAPRIQRIFDFKDYKVMIDFAHNADGFRGIKEFL